MRPQKSDPIFSHEFIVSDLETFIWIITLLDYFVSFLWSLSFSGHWWEARENWSSINDRNSDKSTVIDVYFTWKEYMIRIL